LSQNSGSEIHKPLSDKGEIFLEFAKRAKFFLRVLQKIEATEDMKSMVLATDPDEIAAHLTGQGSQRTQRILATN
jgi:hypothetical protein